MICINHTPCCYGYKVSMAEKRLSYLVQSFMGCKLLLLLRFNSDYHGH